MIHKPGVASLFPLSRAHSTLCVPLWSSGLSSRLYSFCGCFLQLTCSDLFSARSPAPAIHSASLTVTLLEILVGGVNESEL